MFFKNENIACSCERKEANTQKRIEKKIVLSTAM